MKNFESMVIQQRAEDAQQEEVLIEISRQMPFTIKGAARSQESMMRNILDYKTEMCTMIDNITNVEVFRCLDIDMPDNFMANLQVQQIQRLMKIKTELQGASPDIREVQLTLKRFLIDLDVKEAYEFSILNAFLINEEELNAILADVEKQQQFSANTYQSNISVGMQLDLPRRRQSSSDGDEEESPSGSSQVSPIS